MEGLATRRRNLRCSLSPSPVAHRRRKGTVHALCAAACLALCGCSLGTFKLHLKSDGPALCGGGAPVILVPPPLDERAEKDCVGRVGRGILGSEYRVVCDPDPVEALRVAVARSLEEQGLAVVAPGLEPGFKKAGGSSGGVLSTLGSQYSSVWTVLKGLGCRLAPILLAFGQQEKASGNPAAAPAVSHEYALAWRVVQFGFTKQLDPDLIHDELTVQVDVAWSVRRAKDDREVLAGSARSNSVAKVRRQSLLAPYLVPGDLARAFETAVADVSRKVATDIAAAKHAGE